MIDPELMKFEKFKEQLMYETVIPFMSNQDICSLEFMKIFYQM